MIKSFIAKIKYVLLVLIITFTWFSFPAFSAWGVLPSGDMFWYEPDGTIAYDGWKLIENGDTGYAYYYYFDKNGVVLRDDITPDYYVVSADGRYIDDDGYIPYVYIGNAGGDLANGSMYSAEMLQDVQNNSAKQKSIKSTGQFLYVTDPSLIDGPTPSDNIVIEVNPDGTARSILGKNVVLKNKATGSNAFNAEMDRNMQNYIQGGNNYSKKVNGTTYTKSKWKEVMALKGGGATIIFENPSNNFNKLKGRIATHYFTYTDRTTTCTLNIYNEDENELLYTTSDFNYNNGATFECTFKRKVNKIKFELEIDGQYGSRICYLRKCEYGFDREAYEEELYEEEIEAENRAYEEEFARIFGTNSEIENEESEREEMAVEGESPDARWRRINNISDDEYWLSFDEDDENLTAAMRASISEARKRLAESDEKHRAVSGPAFDPALKDMKEAVGPDGSSRIVPVGKSSDD
ncbi:MAG: hypothetical protein J6O09_00145 [Lachnospiraceae bacterium]|nr:hypothetical protein [Lachnospiraceae bacterium]